MGLSRNAKIRRKKRVRCGQEAVKQHPKALRSIDLKVGSELKLLSAMRRRQRGRQVAVKVDSSSFDGVQVSGCRDDVVGPIIRGSYTLQERNHDRPVFRKDEKFGKGDVMLYFWEDKESPDFSGWWFGTLIGGDEVWAFHPDTSAKSPPTSGWQCPFDGPVDSSIEVVARLVKGAAVPGRQPGTVRKELSPVLSAAEQQAKRQKELELMKQHEEISIRLAAERERLAIQRQEEMDRRKALEEERKRKEHHIRLTLRRALQKLRLAKPETFKELTAEVEQLLETDYLDRRLREEAEIVKYEAKVRVQKILHFLQKADQKKREAQAAAEETKRQQDEVSKKLTEELSNSFRFTSQFQMTFSIFSNIFHA